MWRRRVDKETLKKDGEKIIQNIESLVQRVRRDQSMADGDGQLCRFLWLRHVKKAKRLEETMQAHKASICNLSVFAML